MTVTFGKWTKPPRFDVYTVQRRDRMLQVFVMRAGPRKWVTLALEGPPLSAVQGLPALAAAGVVFDDHAHEVLGEDPTCTAARARGERYARRWRRRRVQKSAPCACEEVGMAPVAGVPT